jgi:hypothetical protein
MVDAPYHVPRMHRRNDRLIGEIMEFEKRQTPQSIPDADQHNDIQP